MERLFASADPLDVNVDRIIACSDRYPAPIEERILRDGAVHLIFNLGDRPTGERGAELACLAIGATCEPTRIVLAGAIEQLCVRLRVGTAAAVLGVPAGELTDRGVALDALWGVAAAEMLERLDAAPRAAARAAVFARVLRDRLGRAEPPSPTALEAVRRIAASAGRIRVRDLAAQLGVGERRLQQVFHEQIGLSPKATCRLARFRAVLARRRREPGRSWTEVALDGDLKVWMFWKTGATMVLFAGAYAVQYGWAFGVGLVALILVHEMGHVWAAHRVGVPVSAPMFLPFFGAYVKLRGTPRSTYHEFIIAAGGPLLGSAAAMLCLAASAIFDGEAASLLRVVGYYALVLNLFNLTPIWVLDGARMLAPVRPRDGLIGAIARRCCWSGPRP